jgi:hypothetical protein
MGSFSIVSDIAAELGDGGWMENYEPEAYDYFVRAVVANLDFRNDAEHKHEPGVAARWLTEALDWWVMAEDLREERGLDKLELLFRRLVWLLKKAVVAAPESAPGGMPEELKLVREASRIAPKEPFVFTPERDDGQDLFAVWLGDPYQGPSVWLERFDKYGERGEDLILVRADYDGDALDAAADAWLERCTELVQSEADEPEFVPEMAERINCEGRYFLDEEEINELMNEWLEEHPEIPNEEAAEAFWNSDAAMELQTAGGYGLFLQYPDASAVVELPEEGE